MVLGAVGSDTGGSIRIPAAACGLFGLKPTFGLINCEGVVPQSWTLDHLGPLTRTVEDLGLMMQARIGGPRTRTQPQSRMRIALSKDLLEAAGSEVRAAFESSLGWFRRRGAEIETFLIPDLALARRAWLTILLAESVAYHRPTLEKTPEVIGDDIRPFLLAGLLIDASTYLGAQRFRREWASRMRAMMRDLDILAHPTFPMATPLRDQSEVETGGGTMRYRHVEQAIFVGAAGPVGCVMYGLRRPRLLCADLERLAVFCDAVDRVQQFAHGGDEGKLGWFSGGAQAFIEGAQPGIAAHGAEHRHPERHAQTGIAERADGGARAGTLAGLLEAGDDADIGREGGGAAEAGGVADGGDDTGGRLRSDPLDGGQQLADLVGVEQVFFDVALDVGQAPSPQIEVLADMAGLQRVGRSVVLADGAFGSLDQLLGQLGADQVTPVVAKFGEPSRVGASEGLCGWVFGEQAGGEHAVEGADVAGELGEAEIDQAMELADAVVEVLAQPVAVADHLAQALGDLVVQPGRRGALFEAEAGEPVGVDGVGFGAFEAAVLEAPCNERVEECDVTSRGNRKPE